jgi:F-type H+-transporting ATPase subunit delta
MDLRAAKRYAKALFQAAQKVGVVDSVESDLESLKNLLKNDERTRNFFFSPHAGREEKIRIAEKVFSDRVTALTMHVVRLMLSKRRETELPELYEQFVILRQENDNVLPVVITSAYELSESERQRILEKLAQKSGQRIEATYKVEPSLVGGVRVAYGNFVLDGSVKGTMNRLRDQLRVDLLKQSL